jgi:hypothetical protein
MRKLLSIVTLAAATASMPDTMFRHGDLWGHYYW